MFELVLRIGFSLFVVLGLMWALARVVRRPLGAGRTHGRLAVLNRQQLTRGAAVTVVKVADRAMILGITEQQVSFLGEAELADFESHHEHRDTVDLPGAHPEATPGRLDRSLLDFLRDRTSRR
ncbi:MAG TPA: flagellar biosynthetic protein FliO [Nocardioidaceae bacterium]|nr:flagellar biosynthetic protein FliO [Nocardioidaceae bacterium]